MKIQPESREEMRKVLDETYPHINYIQQFMNDNAIVIGQPFKVSVSKRLWFCFCDDFCIDLVGDDEIMRDCTDFSSILFRLLTGEVWITDHLGQ